MSLYGVIGKDVDLAINSLDYTNIPVERDMYGQVVIKIPVVNKQHYTMYLELFNGLLWFHTDVHEWTATIKNSFIKDLDMLQHLLEIPLVAMSRDSNKKLIKFGESIGFKYKRDILGKDNHMYVIYSRSK
jgi:hypothetical protein